MTHLIIVPGINGSDSVHWQSRWEQQAESPDLAEGTTFARIAPASWDEPDLTDWLAAIDRTVDAAPPGFYFVAHSLGCIAVAAWLAAASASSANSADSGNRADRGCAGAFLVAPPDTTAATFPDEASSFRLSAATTATATALGVPALLLSSANDPYCSPARSAALAEGWAAEHHDVGRFGHLNSSSDLADWPVGRRLLAGFTAAGQHPTP